MSVSLPARVIFAIDVPEVKEFVGTFQYNFYVQDESVTETSGIPKNVLMKRTDEFDSGFIDLMKTRTPRFIKFSWKIPKLKAINNSVTDSDALAAAMHKTHSTSTLIKDNLQSIVTEEQLSMFDYTSVTFNEGDLHDSMHSFVSGSFQVLTLGEQNDSDQSGHKIASNINDLTPDGVKFDFLAGAMGDIPNVKFENGKATVGNGSRVNFYSQINSKLLSTIVRKVIQDPMTQHTTDMAYLLDVAAAKQSLIGAKNKSILNESELKPTVPYVDVLPQGSTPGGRSANIVGYIIEKFETQDGVVKRCDPIIIDNPLVNNTVDARIKYGTHYTYMIRTVAECIMPAINADNNEIAMIKILVASKTTRVDIDTLEEIAPPPPTDINFTWNYSEEKLLIHWTLPTNSQRDITKFQVYRRSSVEHPFELLRVLDFDFSAVQASDKESIPKKFVEKNKNVITHFIDDDFSIPRINKAGVNTSTKFIYTVCSVDAHGFISNYGAQFEVSFDVFKNKLIKRLISHSGAPKSYPNMYLEADTFVDTMTVSGLRNSTATLYFNPQFYVVENSKGNKDNIVVTDETGGKYKIQFINLDNQKSSITTVNIKNMLSKAPKNVKEL